MLSSRVAHFHAGPVLTVNSAVAYICRVQVFCPKVIPYEPQVLSKDHTAARLPQTQICVMLDLRRLKKQKFITDHLLHPSNPSQRSDRGGGSRHGPALQTCDTNDAYMEEELHLTPPSPGHESSAACDTSTTILYFNVTLTVLHMKILWCAP